jgi:hypothetical protein
VYFPILEKIKTIGRDTKMAMMGRVEQHKIAVISCLETVLMGMGNTKYHMLVSKLDSYYGITIRECFEHPEHLKSALKEVYPENYNHIISEMKARLDELVNEKDVAGFFNIMES